MLPPLHVVPIRADFKAVHFVIYERGWREVGRVRGGVGDRRPRGHAAAAAGAAALVAAAAAAASYRLRRWPNVAIKNGRGEWRADSADCDWLHKWP